MELEKAVELMKKPCAACGQPAIEGFEGDASLDLLNGCLTAWNAVGVPLCASCAEGLSEDSDYIQRVQKKLDAGFAPKVEFSKEEMQIIVRGAVNQLDKGNRSKQANSSEEGKLMSENKEQRTHHIRQGKTVNTAHCDVVEKQVEIVVVDDNQVKVGCEHYSQGGFFEKRKGACKKRSGLLTRMCIFHHEEE